MLIRRLPVLLLLLAAACSEQTLTTAPSASLPKFEIADAARAWKAGFYWLPPMVAAPAYGGTFDADVSPTVEICELAAEQCGPVIAIFTATSGPGGETLRLDLDDEHFHVNWHTDAFALSSSALYRISVRAGVRHVVLGFADVQVVDNGKGLRNVDTDEFIGLVDGRTLPIMFRVERGIVGEVEVSPLEVTLEPDDTWQVAALTRDLHGNPLSTGVSWSSSDETVATVDQNGLVTALEEGTVTITAIADRITGTATVIVERQEVEMMLSAGSDHACLLDRTAFTYCWGEGSLGQLGDGSAVDRLSPVALAGGLRLRAIDAGQMHSCGIGRAGVAYCWGSNATGQLGDGGSSVATCGAQPCSPVPVMVAGGHAFAVIAGGSRNTCALTGEGVAFCWGEGAFGANGNGTTTRSLVPVQVSGNHAFAAIDVGFDVSCGITVDGAAWCWGSGTGGKLGNGSTAHRSTPVAVSGGLTFAQISVGSSHTCGVTTTGAAYCWGVGTFGRLGTGSTTGRLTPVAVSGGHTFASISAGGEHTCAVTTAGEGYCWGANGNGRVGDGTQSTRTTPSLVAGGHTFASISAGAMHSCGMTVEGQTYCWGAGSSGQLGNGTSTTASFTPVPIAAFMAPE